MISEWQIYTGPLRSPWDKWRPTRTSRKAITGPGWGRCVCGTSQMAGSLVNGRTVNTRKLSALSWFTSAALTCKGHSIWGQFTHTTLGTLIRSCRYLAHRLWALWGYLQFYYCPSSLLGTVTVLAHPQGHCNTITNFKHSISVFDQLEILTAG